MRIHHEQNKNSSLMVAGDSKEHVINYDNLFDILWLSFFFLDNFFLLKGG